MAEYSWAIPALPLAAFLFNGLFGPRYLGRIAGVIASLAIGGAFIASALLWFDLPAEGSADRQQELYRWIASGDLTISIGFLLDELAVVMLLVVTGVSFLVHVYSTAYMAHDPSQARFFVWLPLFVFSMILLVMADNFLLLFVFWEMVGVCSYLLIGCWHRRNCANDAAIKAFVTNRIGDFGFAAGVFLVFWTFGTLDYHSVHEQGEQASTGVLLAIALLLFVGAMGKSAQFPLHVWLPDAMEGPTPVSALIHAATMVTAGVYMVARHSVIFEASGDALLIVGGFGAFTALLAATIGCVQTDIKRVLAYSTVSQLGLMFMGLGAGAYIAAIFHLVTHAFFKALLFLGSGSVIHAMDDEQDMRRYGGLARKLPWTYATFLLGGIALAAVFPLAGFWSKDELIASTYAAGASSDGNWGFLIYFAAGLVTSLLTAFYTIRMIVMTFHGSPRDQELYDHAHESPLAMVSPLVILAALSVVAGVVLGIPPEHGIFHDYLGHVLHSIHFKLTGDETLTIVMALVSTAVALGGVALAWAAYSRGIVSVQLLRKLAPGFYKLAGEKYYMDHIGDGLITGGTRTSAFFLWGVDARLVDGIVNLIGWLVRAIAAVARRLQTGQVQNYTLLVVLGIAAVVGSLLLA